MKTLAFCLLLAGIGFSAAVFPQFKMAFDYQQVEIIKTDILQPFIAQMPDMGLNWTLPVNISGVTGNISNLTIMNITLDWENTHLIEPYNNNGFAIVIRNLTTTIKFDAKLKYKYIDYISGSDNYLTIESLDLFLPFGFVADSTSYYTYIQPDASVVMQNFKVDLSGIFSVISTIITPLGSQIAKILSSVATSEITKYNDTLIAQSSFGVGTTLFDTIQLNLTFANPPSQFYVAGDTYGSMQFDLLVTNVKTGQVAPLLSDDDLTNYTIGGLPMQFMIGEQMISELVWAVFQSGKVNVTISNATAPPQVPVQLYTDDLIILFPNLPQDFGADKGCYINIQAGGQDPIAYIRDGRIVLEVAIGFNVWVDTSSAQYPQQGLDNCTTCQLAIALNMSAFVAVDVYTFNSTTIGARVLDVYMNKVQLMQGNLDPVFFQSALNGLLVPIVEQINDSIESGVQIPFIQLIQLYGLDNLDVFIGEGFLQFGLEMVQKNNNPSFMWLAPYLQQAI